MTTHRGQPPHGGLNGQTFELARALGELGAESRRHTELLLQQQHLLIHLPDRLALTMSRHGAHRPKPAPPPRGILEKLGSLRDWMVAAVALGALTAAIVGKFPWHELPDLLGKLLK